MSEMEQAAYFGVLNAEDECDRLRGKLAEFADWLERDRREPDKVLCVVQSMRREAHAPHRKLP